MLTPSEARAAERFRNIFSRCFENANPNAIRALLDKMQNAASDPARFNSADPADRVARRVNLIAADVAAQVARPLLSKHTKID